jgi:hypothetical protein
MSFSQPHGYMNYPFSQVHVSVFARVKVPPVICSASYSESDNSQISTINKGTTGPVVICSASDSESDKSQISITNNSGWHTFLKVAEQ